MSTQKYQLFFVMGLSMGRPYNSLEFWPTLHGNKIWPKEELLIHSMLSRQIYEAKA